MNRYKTMVGKYLIYLAILLTAFPASAVIKKYNDWDIQKLQLEIQRLDKEIQLLKLKQVNPILGSGARLKQILRVASSTQMYFGRATALDSRATTTGLTLTALQEYDQVSVGVEIFASTTASNQGTTYIQPQTSVDAQNWFDWLPQRVETSASPATTITLPSGTSTTFVIPAGDLGTTTRQINFGTVIGRYMRFLVNTTGTSTILLHGFLQL